MMIMIMIVVMSIIIIIVVVVVVAVVAAVAAAAAAVVVIMIIMMTSVFISQRRKPNLESGFSFSTDGVPAMLGHSKTFLVSARRKLIRWQFFIASCTGVILFRGAVSEGGCCDNRCHTSCGIFKSRVNRIFSHVFSDIDFY
jgi:hypothetical protein